MGAGISNTGLLRVVFFDWNVNCAAISYESCVLLVPYPAWCPPGRVHCPGPEFPLLPAAQRPGTHAGVTTAHQEVRGGGG